MADLVKEPEQDGTAPPVGEEIHMPASSVLPLINAAALAGAIVTITFNTVLCILLAIAFLWTTVIWVRDTRRDIAELPLDRSHH
jgi:hypothetical protein